MADPIRYINNAKELLKRSKVEGGIEEKIL
jgi:hypothetical protein